MATLTGQRVKDSYKDLLQVSNSNSGITSTLTAVQDGEGNSSKLELSTNYVNVNTAGALYYAGVAITATAAELNVLDGITATVSELNILDGVTATATEINLLDGVTATTSELNILDGVTATASELNILDGVTATASELNIMDGVTATTAELNYVDGVTSNIQTQLDSKISATLTQEQVEDFVGGMLDGTETGISVSYDDTDGNIDFVVATQSDNNFTTALLNKLNAIEASADVTDTANVTSAGALMDSELTSIADVKALDQSVISGASPTFGTANMSDASNKRFMTDAQETKLDSVESNATADQTDEEIQDVVGAMFDSNTETGITATYQDADGTIDLVVGTLNQDTTGNAATATKIASITNSDIVQLTDTQTLTNKTLASPAFTGDIDFSDASTPRLDVTDTTNTVTTRIQSQDSSGTVGTSTNHNFGINRNSVSHILLYGGYTMHNGSGNDIDFRAKDSSGNVVFKVDAGDSKTHITTLDVSGDADIDGTLEADAITVNGTALNTVIAGVTVANATLAATATVSDSTANTNFPVVFHDESNGLLDDTGALRYNPSTGTLLVPNLSVAGTTTTVDTVTMEASNAIIFEGATADAHETTLSIVDPTGDRTINLPNVSGTIPVLAAASTTQISSTPEELNILDGKSFLDEDDMSSNSATGIASQQSIKAYVDSEITSAGAGDITAVTFQTDSGSGSKASDTGGSADFILQGGTGVDVTNSSTTITVAADVSDFMSNGSDNRILTATGTDAMNAEANFTFNGTHARLAATSALYFDGGTHTYIQESSDDTLKIFVGGSSLLELVEDSTDYVRVLDNTLLGVGSSNDMNFKHDGTNSYITNDTGHLYIRSGADDKQINIQADDGSGGMTDYMRFSGSESLIRVYKNIRFGDTVNAHFGDDADLQIRHDGSNSIIKADGTGDLTIRQDTADKDILLRSDDGSGGIETYMQIDGSASRVSIPSDNIKLTIGAGADLKAYHDGTNSYITNATGRLIISQQTDDSFIDFKCDDGSGGVATYLSLNGANTRIDVSKNILFDDSVSAQFGDGGDLQIVHDGTLSHLTNSTGTFYLHQNATDEDFFIKVDDGGTDINALQIDASDAGTALFNHDIKMVDSAQLMLGTGLDFRLQHDGSNNYITASTSDQDIYIRVNDGGSTITAIQIDASDAGSAIFSHDVKVNDNGKLKAGDGNDLQIYHNGTNSFIDNTTGYVKFRNTLSDADMYLSVNDGGSQINAITIDASETGRVKLPNDNQYLSIGASGDLYFYHDGSNSLIRNSTGNLLLRNDTDDGDIILQSDDGSGGTTDYLRLDGSAEKIIISKNMRFADSVEAMFGAGEDLEIKHDGSNSYIKNDTGDLYIQNTADDKDIVLQSDDGSGGVENYMQIDGSAGRTLFNKNIRVNDSVEVQVGSSADLRLYHDGSNSNIVNGTGDFYLYNTGTQDKDIIFVVNDGGSNVTAMKIDASETARVKLPNDNQRLTFGASDDLHLEHSGTDSYISNQTGDLYIQNQADDKDIIFRGDDGSGGNTAYLTIDGGDVRIKAHKDLRFDDSEQLQVGAAADAKFYHDGSNTYLDNTGANNFIIQQSGDDQDLIFKCDDGSGGVTSYLTLDGSASIITTSVNNRFDDSKKLLMGAGSDLHMYHDGTHSYLYNYTGDFKITNFADDKDIILSSDDGSGGTTAYLTIDGSAELTQIDKDMRFQDDTVLQIGSGNDLRLTHQSSTSFIHNNTGTFNIQQRVDDGDLILSCDDGSGGYTAYLTLDGSATQTLLHQDTSLTATKKLYLDGGGNTYIFEDTADRLRFFCGGAEFMRFTEDTSDTLGLYTNNTIAMTINNSQNVGIGVSSPDSPLHIGNNVATSAGFDSFADYQILLYDTGTSTTSYGMGIRENTFMFNSDVDFEWRSDNSAKMLLQSDGDLHLTADVVAYSTTPSDIRLKKNFTKIENGLDVVSKLEGHTFNWKKGGERLSAGFKAQEVEKILPHLVDEKTLPLKSNDEKEYKTLRYEELIPYLVEAIKEQQVQIEELKSKIGE